MLRGDSGAMPSRHTLVVCLRIIPVVFILSESVPATIRSSAQSVESNAPNPRKIGNWRDLQKALSHCSISSRDDLTIDKWREVPEFRLLERHGNDFLWHAMLLESRRYPHLAIAGMLCITARQSDRDLEVVLTIASRAKSVIVIDALSSIVEERRWSDADIVLAKRILLHVDTTDEGLVWTLAFMPREAVLRLANEAVTVLYAPDQVALVIQLAAGKYLSEHRPIPDLIMEAIIKMEYVPGQSRLTYIMFCPTSVADFAEALLEILNSVDIRGLDKEVVITARLDYLRTHFGTIRDLLKREVRERIEKRLNM